MSFLRRFGFFFLLLFIITALVFFYLGRPVNGIDDGNIFLRYARNIAGGNGFVFNPGGERVEGFTSLLWVLICSAFYIVSSSPEIVLMFFLLLLTTLTITIVYDEVKKDVDLLHSLYAKKRFLWLYTAFIICIGPSFVAWSVLSLMENGLWNFLFASIVIFVLQFDLEEFSSGKKLLLLGNGILLILTRPESLAWTLLFTFLLAISQKKNKGTLAYPALFLAVMVITSACLTYFRLHYFGYPFPNTYYAKVSHNLLYNFKEGLKYIVHFLTAYNSLVTLLFILLVAVAFNKRNLFRALRISIINESPVLYRILVITIIIVFSIFLPITTGGDHFGSFRFYQSILPLFVWGGVSALWLYKENIRQKTNRNWFSLGMIAVLFFSIISISSLLELKKAPESELSYEFYLANQGRETAKDFNAIWRDNLPSVGVITVGGFALKYNGTTIDLMGLNNTLMGHSKGKRTGIKNHAAFSKDVFYRLQPDLILPKKLEKPENAPLTYAEYLNLYNFDNRAMKNIFNDTAFQQSYHPVLIQRYNIGYSFFAFAKNEFLNKMSKDSTLGVTAIKL